MLLSWSVHVLCQSRALEILAQLVLYLANRGPLKTLAGVVSRVGAQAVKRGAGPTVTLLR